MYETSVKSEKKKCLQLQKTIVWSLRVHGLYAVELHFKICPKVKKPKEYSNQQSWLVYFEAGLQGMCGCLGNFYLYFSEFLKYLYFYEFIWISFEVVQALYAREDSRRFGIEEMSVN